MSSSVAISRPRRCSATADDLVSKASAIESGATEELSDTGKPSRHCSSLRHGIGLMIDHTSRTVAHGQTWLNFQIPQRVRARRAKLQGASGCGQFDHHQLMIIRACRASIIHQTIIACCACIYRSSIHNRIPGRYTLSDGCLYITKSLSHVTKSIGREEPMMTQHICSICTDDLVDAFDELGNRHVAVRLQSCGEFTVCGSSSSLRLIHHHGKAT